VDALSAKQQRFVEEYLVDLNATKAAERAGYSAKSAQVTGSRLLSNAMVQAAIQERQQKRAVKLDITVDRIELELARIAFSDMRRVAQWGPTKAAQQSEREAEAESQARMGDDEGGNARPVPPNGVMLLPSDELSDDDAAAVAQVTEAALPGGGLKYGIKLHDKMKALELLGKRHGMFVEKHEHKHDVSWADLVKAATAQVSKG
jgi:phage terminase small subunit